MKALFKFMLACTLCAGQFVLAQEPIYKWGEPATNDNVERRVDKLLSLGNDGFVLLRKTTDATTTEHFWLEHYNADLKMVGITEVAFNNGVMGDAYFLEDIVAVNGQIYAFVTHWNKALGEHSLSIKALGLDGSLKDIKDLDVIKAQKMGNRGMYSMAFSDDGSKLLLLSELPFVKKTNEKLRLSCFEIPSMNQLWVHEEELDWSSERGINNEVAVDNLGRAYLFKKVWVKPEWQYSLYATNGKGEWKDHSKLGLEGKEIVDHKMTFDTANDLLFYATYTTKPSAYKKELHGSVYVHLNAEQDVQNKRVENWDKAMVTHFKNEKTAQDENRSHIDDFGIKDILFRADGKMLVLLEQTKFERNTIAGSSPIKFSYEWEYGDLLVLNIEPNNGELLWWQSFQKHQETRADQEVDPYGSIVYHLKADRLYLLWNNTDLSVPSIPAANWTEPDGTKYVKHKAFDDKTMHATFLRLIEPDGSLGYADRKYGLPLFHLHEGAVFEMSLTTPFFFDLNGDLVVMAAMHNGGKRYRFGFVGL